REAGVLLTLRDVRRDLQLEAELLRREAVLSHHVRHAPYPLSMKSLLAWKTCNWSQRKSNNALMKL
ncbi:MAG: hypothetical protein SVT56_12245, partial [Chloroflexota bacterium]|nr:hypothetical protein [Chloroflexota bacterium]